MKKITKGRDEDSVIGGVCFGLGEYFEIDPVLIRVPLAMLAFGYGFGFLLYYVFWISMPEHSNQIANKK